GLLCLVLTAIRPHAGGDLWRFALPLAVFIILTTVAELFPVSFELGRYEITVSTVFLVGSILVFHDVPQLAVLTALVSALTANLLARKPWFKVCTNVALAVTAVSISSIAFGLIGAADLLHLVAATAALLLVYFQAERLRTESITALQAMADLIENRDVYTHDHTESVSAWSRRLAERMGFDAREVWKVAVAGRLHDLGKVAVSDTILLKPGKLDAD